MTARERRIIAALVAELERYQTRRGHRTSPWLSESWGNCSGGYGSPEQCVESCQRFTEALRDGRDYLAASEPEQLRLLEMAG